MREALEAAEPDALIVVAAEHFANFFMNNMPAYCIGMADSLRGPDRGRAWLGIKRRRVPGNADLSRRLIGDVMRRRRRRVRGGVEVRPRHHGAAALPDAALRPAGDSGEHQLPGPAAHAARARLRVRPRAAPRVRRAARAHRAASAPAASRTGPRRRTPARSTRRGTAPSSSASSRTTARRSSPIATRRPARRRAGRLRDPHVHRRRRRHAKARPASSCSTRRSRSSRSAAPSRR